MSISDTYVRARIDTKTKELTRWRQWGAPSRMPFAC